MKVKLELIDLGDATEETKQLMPIAVFHDHAYALGLLPNI